MSTTTQKAGALSLRATLRMFVSYGSPALLALVATGCIVARIVLGDLGLIDAVVVAGLLAFYPFQEWLIHVFILHQPARKIFGRTFQLNLAKKHKAHHEEPWELRWVMIPWRTHLVSLAVVLGTLACVTAAARPYVLTGFASLWCLGLTYEWVHFVSHVPYKARSRWLRELVRLHRLHHFKSEENWHGVATHLADRVLGTYPDPASTPTSATCRTLRPEESLTAGT